MPNNPSAEHGTLTTGLTPLQRGWLSRLLAALGTAAFLGGAVLALGRMRGDFAPVRELPLLSVVVAVGLIGFAIAVSTVTRPASRDAKDDTRVLVRPALDARLWVAPTFALIAWFMAADQRMEGMATSGLLALGFAAGYAVRLAVAMRGRKTAG